jgi:hypothetical protein
METNIVNEPTVEVTYVVEANNPDIGTYLINVFKTEEEAKEICQFARENNTAETTKILKKTAEIKLEELDF